MPDKKGLDKETHQFYEQHVLPEFGIKNTQGVRWEDSYKFDEDEKACFFGLGETIFTLIYTPDLVTVEDTIMMQGTPISNYKVVRTMSGEDRLDLSTRHYSNALLTKGFITLVKLLPLKRLEANSIIKEEIFYTPVFASEVKVRGRELKVYLRSENENSRFTSMIMPGESLDSAVRSDLKQHFGFTDEEVAKAGVGVGEEKDSALDQQGRPIPRFFVHCHTPYLPALDNIHVTDSTYRWFIKNDGDGDAKYVTLQSYTDTLKDESMPAYNGMVLILRQDGCWWLSSRAISLGLWLFPGLDWHKPIAESLIHQQFGRILGEVTFNFVDATYRRIKHPPLFKIKDYRIVTTKTDSLGRITAIVQANVEAQSNERGFVARETNTHYRLFTRQELKKIQDTQNNSSRVRHSEENNFVFDLVLRAEGP